MVVLFQSNIGYGGLRYSSIVLAYFNYATTLTLCSVPFVSLTSQLLLLCAFCSVADIQGLPKVVVQSLNHGTSNGPCELRRDLFTRYEEDSPTIKDDDLTVKGVVLYRKEVQKEKRRQSSKNANEASKRKRQAARRAAQEAKEKLRAEREQTNAVAEQAIVEKLTRTKAESKAKQEAVEQAAKATLRLQTMRIKKRLTPNNGDGDERGNGGAGEGGGGQAGGGGADGHGNGGAGRGEGEEEGGGGAGADTVQDVLDYCEFRKTRGNRILFCAPFGTVHISGVRNPGGTDAQVHEKLAAHLLERFPTSWREKITKKA